MSHPVLTKKYHFCASHKYGNSYWSDEKNYQVFGKDYDTHGHNYVLEVSLTGKVNPDTGWLTDLQKLNKLVKEKVTGVLDHSQIELKVPWFKGKQPSSEEIVVWIWEQLEPNIAEGKLYKIRLVETHSIYTDYYGPDR